MTMHSPLAPARPQASRNLAPAIVHEVLRAPGRALDVVTRAAMESSFRHDFGRVRVHADARAAESARAVSASAYTVGRDLVFGAGRFAPETPAGRRLLAHELAHVVQQGDARGDGAPLALGRHDDATERDAEQAANGFAAGATNARLNHRAPLSVQRSPLRGDDDPIHTPIVDRFRRKHGLPPGGVDESGARVGPSTAEIKYGDPALATAVADKLQKLIAGATWKEIRKRVYPKESAAGVQRAKDRRAGTLPDLTGLGRLTTLDHFAAAVRGLQKKWAGLKPDDRVQELGKAANAELVGAAVPAFLTVDKAPMEFKGFFRPSAWMFVISQELVTNDVLGNDDAAELSNTTLHEGRHAEQHFLAARFSAGENNKDEAQIVAEQHIPAAIAKEAVAKKFSAATDATTKALGRRMFQAMITDGATNQAISNDDGLADLETKRKAAETALVNLDAVPTGKTIADAAAKADDLRKQITVVEQKYTPYRNIPYEADAHEVGDAAELAFKGLP